MKLVVGTALLMTLIGALVVAVAPKGNRWVWADHGDRRAETDVGYQVHEYPSSESEYFGGGPSSHAPVQFRPQYSGPYRPESRPIVPAASHPYQGPSTSAPVLLGPTGIIGRPNRKPLGPGFNGGIGGSIPHWTKEDHRYREYDVCKCSSSFNCPGLKLGSCAEGKQYCCYDSRKFSGLTAPGYTNQKVDQSRPFNAIPSNHYYGQHGPQGSHYESYQTNQNHDRYGLYAPGYNRPYGGVSHERPYYGLSEFARSASKSHEDERDRERSTDKE